MKSSKKLVKIAIKIIHDKIVHKRISGVPSGFVEIDEFTNGWQPGQLIVIAARPGMGKSAFTKSIILNAAIKFIQSVALFTLEISDIRYMNMMIASETKIPYSLLGKDNDWYGLNKKLKKLTKAPIFIDDTPSISLTSLKDKIVKLKYEKDIKLVVIDYLQLITFRESFRFNRTQELNIISRNLKKIAKELNLPIIVLSSLPNSVEKRKNKLPKLKDLRRITAIELHADIVAFLYRPEYYGINKWDWVWEPECFGINELKWDGDGKTTEGQAEFIIAKNRNGLLNNFRLNFKASSLNFLD